MTENDIGTVIIKTATEIHRKLGSGLLENVYEVVLTRELKKQGLKAERQIPIPIKYDGL